MIECMFEEAIARLDELFERQHPSVTPVSAALLERIGVFSRVENRAAAEQLTAIGDLFAHRLSRCSECEEWAVDTEAAVSAEVAAELRIGQGLAGSKVRYARAMRERLPEVGAVFAAGDIDYSMFQTIVFRTGLIDDPEVLARVDAELAVNAARWPSMTRGRLAAQVDKIVARADADAVRRRKELVADRRVWVVDVEGGWSHIEGSLLARTRTRWTNGWMHWRPRCVPTIRAAVSSAAPTRWGRWRAGRTDWDVAAGAAIARQARGPPRDRW
ncbi:hypothetical protein MMAN_34680 [Mycobacterium mantenii]|uniref:DUF222 domain-containing protein n=1 Tax=Mycobacterium mantenii TaxID=560555 RepID=A0ABM7JUT6_MYCNT|nr:hypothetical protein MMAN_34680 [Mycobacterium mantenii]